MAVSAMQVWPQDDLTDCEHTRIKRRSGKVVCSAVAMNDLGSPLLDGE
jgi:hypothetical protein